MNNDENQHDPPPRPERPTEPMPLDTPPAGTTVVRIPGGIAPLVFSTAADARRFTERVARVLAGYTATDGALAPESSGAESSGNVPAAERWAVVLRLRQARTIEEADECLELLSGAGAEHDATERDTRARESAAIVTEAGRRIAALVGLSEEAARHERVAVAVLLERAARRFRDGADAGTLHRLWVEVVDGADRLAALRSWRACTMADAARVAGINFEPRRRSETARVGVLLVEIDAEIDRLEREANEEAAQTAAERTAEEAVRGTEGPLLLSMPLATFARVIEALRRAGFIGPDTPTAAITRRLYVASSRGRDPERSFNAARSQIDASNAADDRIARLVLALAYAMPPEQVEELAGTLSRIARGMRPPEWDQYDVGGNGGGG